MAYMCRKNCAKECDGCGGCQNQNDDEEYDKERELEEWLDICQQNHTSEY